MEVVKRGVELMLRHAASASAPIRVGGHVRAWARHREGGIWWPHGFLCGGADEWDNTATTYALSSLAQYWMGTSNTPGNPNAILPPTYVALGTGTQTPSTADQFMFAEAYGTRVAFAFSNLVTTTTGLLAASYQTTQANGTWTEVGLWDAPTGSATVGTGGVLAGATTLPLGASAPAVQGGSTPGQYTTAYINDGANSEYIAISVTASAGAASWTLQAPLQHNHAASVPITVFNGNLWAHASLIPSLVKASGQQLLVQWSAPFSAA